ncbi:muconolactone Delta-isomerase family protein [Nguyenibacter vanlangensis]|uniref:Muconolactone Delta-isomerase family protein n=1 Tax=Nguyenibacter vanlangensis TaxID=1216886 RepID=A0ABZ3D985_9PROT
MITFIVKYIYNVTRSAREQVMASHRENLEQQAQSGALICAARVEGEEAGVLIYKAEDREKLENILQKEPYKKNGFIEKTEISVLNPTIGLL